ncbi:hypothetical protein GCM10010519_39800 [Streptomyces lactacystinicus]
MFSGPRYGAQAFFQALNDRGGLHGRTVRLVTCDDGGSGVGNQDCMHRLIDREHVFAFVSGSVLDYAGAPYVSGKAVPDVGGQPIGTEYDGWPHLYGIYGSGAPRDGRSAGTARSTRAPRSSGFSSSDWARPAPPWSPTTRPTRPVTPDS